LTLNTAADDPKPAINIPSNITRKRCHESALMSAAHILVCLTQERKSIEQIASEDFYNNLELVAVWVDYMVGINWIHSNNGFNSKNPWIATHNGKNWVEKYSVCDDGQVT
jgi:hypothetical protein